MRSSSNRWVGGCWNSGGGGRGGRDDVEPAAGVRDEIDVVQLEDLVCAGEAPIDGGEEGSLKAGELGRSKAADARIVRVRAERVAV